MNTSGHFWTMAWPVRRRLMPPRAPASISWETTLDDPVAGEVRLTGRLQNHTSKGSPLLLIVHGLGGHDGSGYVISAARAAERAGMDCLRLNLRGADGSGEDFYHAGLTQDVEAALASPSLAGYSTVFLLGFSLGGHLVLRYATGDVDPRVRAVAAVCAPVDLDRCCAAIDSPGLWLYRKYLLNGLNRLYARVAERRPVPAPPAQTRRITTLRGWDAAVVAPRHGFDSAEDYYAKASVGPRLKDLKIPSLLVASSRDPMVKWRTIEPWLAEASPHLHVKLVDEGGHVGFSSSLDLGFGSPRGLDAQVLAWLASHLA